MLKLSHYHKSFPIDVVRVSAIIQSTISPDTGSNGGGGWNPMFFRARVTLFPVAAALLSMQSGAQSQLAGTGPSGLHMMNTDLAVLEAQDVRKDLACTVTPSKPVLGFDLRFHAGY